MTIMECSRIKNMLSAYLDSELPEEDIREVRRHLFTCSKCELELKKIRNMKGLMGEISQSFQPRANYALDFDVIQSRVYGHRMREILMLSVIISIIFLLFVYILPAYKNIMQGTNTDTSLGEIHRNLTGDSFDVPKASGKVVVNFLKQVSSDRE